MSEILLDQIPSKITWKELQQERKAFHGILLQQLRKIIRAPDAPAAPSADSDSQVLLNYGFNEEETNFLLNKFTGEIWSKEELVKLVEVRPTHFPGGQQNFVILMIPHYSKEGEEVFKARLESIKSFCDAHVRRIPPMLPFKPRKDPPEKPSQPKKLEPVQPKVPAAAATRKTPAAHRGPRPAEPAGEDDEDEDYDDDEDRARRGRSRQLGARRDNGNLSTAAGAVITTRARAKVAAPASAQPGAGIGQEQEEEELPEGPPRSRAAKGGAKSYVDADGPEWTRMDELMLEQVKALVVSVQRFITVDNHQDGKATIASVLPEDAFDGLQEALTGFKWRRGEKHVISFEKEPKLKLSKKAAEKLLRILMFDMWESSTSQKIQDNFKCSAGASHIDPPSNIGTNDKVLRWKSHF